MFYVQWATHFVRKIINDMLQALREQNKGI